MKFTEKNLRMLKIKTFILILFLSFLIFGEVKSFALEGDMFLKLCNSQSDYDKGFCLGYTLAIATLVFGSNNACQPPNLTPEAANSTVINWFKTNKSKLKNDAFVLIKQALEENFPCKR